jgi:inorganic phosphate transporter, PiT family
LTVTVLLGLSIGIVLAYANGANDVSKGIATLVGSGVTDYRRAIAWGSAWTGVGGLLGCAFAGAMLSTFGHGLLGEGVAPSFSAVLATLAGAAGWVLLATRTGMPVSTTHAIVGSLVGVAIVAYGPKAVQWSTVGGQIFLPLLLTPLLSFLLTGLLLRWTRASAANETPADCLCAQVAPPILAIAGPAAAYTAAGTAPDLRLQITRGTVSECAAAHPTALRLSIDHLHWLTSGATSLARGMNDAPKIVALLLAAHAVAGETSLPVPWLFACVTFSMVLGSLLAGRRVTHVLAERVTPLSHTEGFAANLVAAALIGTGAVHGLPMSTTHVASGGIVSAGFARGSLNSRTLRDILLAWVLTLPFAALLGVSAHALLRTFGG